jgi:TRAP-type C4-dicarboxylate transport system permease large subunit
MVILVLLFYLFCGTFMDEIAAMFITLPIIWPVLEGFGVDPIWFGVCMCLIQAVGLITPPYGLNIFIIKSVLPDATIEDIIRGCGPFLIMNAVALAIFLAFPQISLFLVAQMK